MWLRRPGARDRPGDRARGRTRSCRRRRRRCRGGAIGPRSARVPGRRGWSPRPPRPATRSTRGVEVVDHERQLLGRLAPVGGAEHRAELRRREQELEDAVRVLAEPQHAVARADPLLGEGVREPVHSGVELGIRQPYGPVDECGGSGPAAPVLAQDVAERERVERVHRPWVGARGQPSLSRCSR